MMQPEGPAIYSAPPQAESEGRLLIALNDTCLVGTASQRAGRWAKRWLGWDWGHDTPEENNGWGTGWGGDWGGEQAQDEQGSQVGQPSADSQGGEEGGAGQQDNGAAVGLMLTCALGTGQEIVVGGSRFDGRHWPIAEWDPCSSSSKHFPPGWDHPWDLPWQHPWDHPCPSPTPSTGTSATPSPSPPSPLCPQRCTPEVLGQQGLAGFHPLSFTSSACVPLAMPPAFVLPTPPRPPAPAPLSLPGSISSSPQPTAAASPIEPVTVFPTQQHAHSRSKACQ
jgi:hypothetical protein